MFKVLFMGTPELGATVLRYVAQTYDVVGVVTQPDRPAGRKNSLTPPPVKIAAQELKLPILQLEELRSTDSQAKLQDFAQGVDVFVVAAFGMLLPPKVLKMPPQHCLNVHGSLLPLYRGASPVAQAILDGQPHTGVTIMRMEKGLDTGPMLSKVVIPILDDETQTSLMDKLAHAGGKLLVETLQPWLMGQIVPEVQDHTQATHTGIISKEAGRLDWQASAISIERKSRAYDVWPGIYTTWQGQTLKLGRCKVIPQKQAGDQASEVGQVLMVDNQLVIQTGQDYLAPLELQLPGKKMTNALEFTRGYRNFVGSQLGS